MKRLLLFIVSVAISTVIFAQTESSWEELYQKGIYFKEHSNSFRAMQYLEQAIEIHPSDTIRRELASTYYNRGKYQKCIDLCQSLLYPDTLETDLYLIARSFEKLEKIDSALVYEIMVADKNIENYNNLVSLCNTLIAAEDLDGALCYLDAYCAVDSTNSSINTVKAYALHKKDRHKEAIRVYEKLKEEGDDRSSTNYYLGLSYYRNKNILDAYDLLKRAVDQTNRKNSAILARFGVVELAVRSGIIPFFPDQKHSEGGYRDDSYLRPIFENVTDFDERMALVDSINKEGIADIQEAIELMQPNKDMLFYLYNNIGNTFTEKRKPKDAITYYNKAKTIYSDRSNIYYQLAYSYHLLKDYKSEMSNYELYIKYAPEDEDPNTIEYAKECIDDCRKVLFMKEK